MGSPGRLVDREGKRQCIRTAQLVLACRKGCQGGRKLRRLNLTGRSESRPVFPLVRSENKNEEKKRQVKEFSMSKLGIMCPYPGRKRESTSLKDH